MATCPGPRWHGTAHELGRHLQTHHAPTHTIPPVAFAAHGIQRCDCGSLLCGVEGLQNHLRRGKANPRSVHYIAPPADDAAAEAAAVAAADAVANTAGQRVPPPTHTTAGEGPSATLESNRDFFASLRLDSMDLQMVRGRALPSYPRSATVAYVATVKCLLGGILRDLSDDAAAAGFHASTRLLLYPPAPSATRGDLAKELTERCTALRRGEGRRLWDAYDWGSTLISTDRVARVERERLPKLINDCIARHNAARAFRCMFGPPSAPPTPRVSTLVTAMIATERNPDLDPAGAIRSAAALALPHAPTTGYIHDTATREAVIAKFTKLFHERSTGAPDGTGLRASYIAASPLELMPLYALLIHCIHLGKVSDGHRRLLQTNVMYGQCKTLDDGSFPTTAAQIAGVRPVKLINIARRAVAGGIGTALTKLTRPYMESLNQWGGSPGGLDAAVRRQQYIFDAHPTIIHSLVDVKNAHSTIARIAVHHTLERLCAFYPGAMPIRDAHRYFLFIYSTPSRTVTQAGATLTETFMTDALDQGDGLSSIAFNLAYTPVLHHAVTSFPVPPHVEPLMAPLTIHDDATLAAPLTLQSPVPPFTEPVDCLYPRLIAVVRDALLRGLRITLVPKKNVHCQPPLPADDPEHVSRLVPHLEPSELVIFDPPPAKHPYHACRLAGGAFGTIAGRTTYGRALVDEYDRQLETFMAVPCVHRHSRLIILANNLRPNVRYNHHLRLMPPSVTAPAGVAETLVHRARRSYSTAIARLAGHAGNAIISAPASTATDAQAFTSAAEGGLDIPCPIILSRTAHLASTADSLPLLRGDPVTAEIASDPDSWHHSDCADFADAAASFRLFADQPTARRLASVEAEHPSALAHAYDATTDTLVIGRLHLCAYRRLQAIMTSVMSAAVLAAHLPTCDTLTRARVAAAKAEGAAALLTLLCLPQAIALADLPLSILICHRIGLAVTPLFHRGYPSTLDLCGPICRVIRVDRPISAHPTLAYTLPHGYHQISCGCDRLRHARHDGLARAFAEQIADAATFAVDLVKHLAASPVSAKKIDLNLTSYARNPPTISFDFSVSCPLLPTYLSAAALDNSHIFRARASEKIRKHFAGCLLLDRLFMPAIYTTLGGVGPASLITFIDDVFRDAAVKEMQAGGRGHIARGRKRLLYAYTHSVIARSAADAIARRLRDTRPRSRPANSSDAPAAAAAPAGQPGPASTLPPGPGAADDRNHDDSDDSDEAEDIRRAARLTVPRTAVISGARDDP